MKAYIANENWSDEGDIFFFSLESEENLKAMKELINIYSELNLLEGETEIYWGTNEYFDFTADDFLRFIDEAVDITEEELAVFKKFRVIGFDIYDSILYELKEALLNYNYWDGRYIIPEYLTQKDLDRIKPAFVKLFEQESWDRVQECFDENRDPF